MRYPRYRGGQHPKRVACRLGGRLVWAPMPQRGLWGHDPTHSKATAGLQKRERTSNSNNKQINKQTQRTKASVFPRPMTSNKHLFTRVSNTVKWLGSLPKAHRTKGPSSLCADAFGGQTERRELGQPGNELHEGHGEELHREEMTEHQGLQAPIPSALSHTSNHCLTQRQSSLSL